MFTWTSATCPLSLSPRVVFWLSHGQKCFIDHELRFLRSRCDIFFGKNNHLVTLALILMEIQIINFENPRQHLEPTPY